MDEIKQTIQEFLKAWNINYHNLGYYRQAVTHGSYFGLKKNQNKNNVSERVGNYQDLEFLGDAILQYLSSDFVFKKFSNLSAGNMTLIRSKLVCTKSLNEISTKIGLKDFLLTAPGQMSKDAKRSVKVGADIFEAFIAAIYLDTNLKVVKEFLNKTVFDIKIGDFDIKHLKDAKTAFQEQIQSFSKLAVMYIVSEKSPTEFEAHAVHDNKIYGIGFGKSKAEAEENAALDALHKMKK
ncbi:ribonuclease III [Mycoplasmopsis fermentans]|uniref:ribonuclease III n=1 Tax=Mycoplasmopsis fermentans TaxID=2115 RepID=UPI000F03F67B|nr:ribonuclease III [Mycoplasmopsis fermentans]RMX35310.1 ribonuclease III [Mycoplasmopsis fermentans MF-I2]